MRVSTIYTLDGNDLKDAIRAYVREIENSSPGGVGTVRKMTMRGSEDNEELPEEQWDRIVVVVEVDE